MKLPRTVDVAVRWEHGVREDYDVPIRAETDDKRKSKTKKWKDWKESVFHPVFLH